MTRPTLQDRIEYAAVIVFVRLMRLLPVRASLSLAGRLGRLAFDVLGFRRSVTVRNLEKHLPESMARAGYTHIGRMSYVQLGMALAEFARLPYVDQAYIEDNVTVEGLDHLDSVLAGGKGAVLVTGHFGSWELMGCVLVRLGYPVTFVVGIQRNPLVQDLMNRIRRASGIDVIELTSTLAIVRRLKANRFVAFLSDQDAGRSGVFVDFMGQPASTPPGAAHLAMLSGAAIVAGFITRIDGLKQHIVIEAPIYPGPADRGQVGAVKLTQAYTNIIEAYIRRCPDHWLWAHRRWKTSAPG
jgi:KDO2-lipid IV(A) lauroyltransferase